ncbi:rod shape-determining protein [Haloplanus halobius]|uniref:rod shape-determining protein n=1 Tax=Haloplanus halobius TaxID=2934938 RepID=UPI0020103A0A|nr:rod shape-determining protein [Haloplanus sp. XH21]
MSDSDAGSDEDEAEAVANEGDEPTPIGVKLGSTRTVIAIPEDGGLRTVKTLTCLATYEDAITGEEKVLYGEEAAREYPDRVQYTLRSGLPEDEDAAELTATFFESVIEANDVPTDSAVVYAIPTIDNERGLSNLESVIEGSSIGETLIRSYPESLCGAVPALGADLEAIDDIFVTVNMGSTNLEASAYRRGEQLIPFTTGAVTGNEVDRRIANYVEEETQGRVNIDTTTAREYKEEHADFVDFEPFTDIIQQPGGGSHEFTIERSVMDAVDEYVDEAVEEVANAFLPDLANDYIKVYQLALDRPIVLTGGMTCIPGIVEEFEERLSDELERDVDVVAPDDPSLSAAVGAQRIAARLVDADAY